MLSKILEHCIVNRYESFLKTSDNQFGFKKGAGCSFAIKTVRDVVDTFNKQGSTAQL